MPERTPEQIGREAGRAMADTMADALDTVILKLTDAIAALRVEQAELRDEVLALHRRIDVETTNRIAADKAILGR